MVLKSGNFLKLFLFVLCHVVTAAGMSHGWPNDNGPWDLFRVNATINDNSAGSQTQLEPRRPLIYVYPVQDRFLKMPDRTVVHYRSFYSLDFIFPLLLHKSPYVTADPNKADYFIFPAYLYYGTNRDLNEMISMMKSLGPWFERKEGADHIFLIADDHGACAYPWSVPEKSIVIQHWGKVHGAKQVRPCNYETEFASKCDEITALEEINYASKSRIHRPCHKLYQHIITPPGMLFEAKEDETFTTHQFSKSDRSTLLFWAGPVPPQLIEAAYSWGVRQLVHGIFKNEPDFRFHLKHIHNYSDEIQNSQFCLAPAGWGWGGRMKAAILNGCIPVVIQPDIKVEWEEQLPLADYAVRLPMYMIPRIADILRDMSKRGRPAQMLEAMRCAWRFHYWQHPEGRAFDLIMCELKARLNNNKVHLDTKTCTLTCGDGIKIDVHNSQPYMV